MCLYVLFLVFFSPSVFLPADFPVLHLKAKGKIRPVWKLRQILLRQKDKPNRRRKHRLKKIQNQITMNLKTTKNLTIRQETPRIFSTRIHSTHLN